MTTAQLFTIIMSFCDINMAKEVDTDRTKHVCFYFMNNCSVMTNGAIDETRINVCKDMWNNNKEKIIKEYEKL